MPTNVNFYMDSLLSSECLQFVFRFNGDSQLNIGRNPYERLITLQMTVSAPHWHFIPPQNSFLSSIWKETHFDLTYSNNSTYCSFISVWASALQDWYINLILNTQKWFILLHLYANYYNCILFETTAINANVENTKWFPKCLNTLD